MSSSTATAADEAKIADVEANNGGGAAEGPGDGVYTGIRRVNSAIFRNRYSLQQYNSTAVVCWGLIIYPSYFIRIVADGRS